MKRKSYSQSCFTKLSGLAVFAALLLLATAASATTYTNTASGNWSTTTIWTPNATVTSAPDTIIQFQPTATLNSTNDQGNFLLNQLWFNPASSQFITNTAAAGNSLIFTNSSALITNTIASTNVINSAINLGTNLTVGAAASGLIIVNSNITQNVAGYSLTKQGAGTLILSGSNTFTGGAVITGGYLTANNNAAMGAGGVTLNTGALRLTINDGLTITNNITINTPTGVAGAGVIQNSSTGNATLSGGTITINGSPASGGHFAAASTGTLTIADPINASVPVNARAGTVIYSGGGTYTAISITGTARLGADNGLSTSATATIGASAAGTLDLAGFNQSLVGIIGVTTPIIGNSSTNKDSLLTLTGTSSYSGVIQDVAGSGTRKVAVTVNGGGLTLSGTNTYSGDTAISAGTLKLATNGTLANTPNILVASGAGFDVSTLTTALTLGSGQTFKASATGGNTTATITVASGKNLTLSAGGLAFTSYGGGVTAPLTLAGTAGALAMNSAPVIVTTTAALANNTYKLVATNGATTVTGTPGTLTVNGAVSPSWASVAVTSGQLILTISGMPAITATPATFPAALSAINGTASSATSVAISGSGLTASITATAPTGLEVSSDGITYGPTATFTQSSGTASGTLSVRLSASAALGTYNSLNVVLSSAGAVSVNVATTASGNVVATPHWTLAASGNWGTAANWFASTIASGSGNTADFSQVDITSDTTVHLDSSYTVGNLIFGNMDASPAANWVVDDNGSAGANTLTLAGTTPTITVTNLGTGKTVTLSAVISGTNGLTKAGPGTLVLAGANTITTITNNTRITSGSLQLNNTLALQNSTLDMNTADAGTLQFGSGLTAATLGGLQGSRSIALTNTAGGAVNLSVGNNNVSTNYTGVLSGSGGGLTKVGTGTFTLGADATFTGPVSVNNGYLAINGGNRLATASGITVVSNAALQATLATTYASVPVTLTGNGVAGDASSAALNFRSGVIVWPGAITLAGGAKIGSFGTANITTLGGGISGTGPLTLSGRGGNTSNQTNTFTLNAQSSYSGATTFENNDGIAEAKFILGVDNALPTTTTLTLRYANNASVVGLTLDLNGHSQTLSGLAHSIPASSSGTKLRIINSTGTGALVISNNVDSSFGGVLGISGLDGLSLTKSGTATLTLTNVNTYTGATTISAGTLALGSNSSISNTASIWIAAGANLDVSAKASPYVVLTNLFASGAAAPALIFGPAGGTVDLAAQAVALNLTFDGSHPVLTVTNATTLAMSGNAIAVTNASGSALGVGLYHLIKLNDGSGSGITGSAPVLAGGVVRGAGVAAGLTPTITVNNGFVNLMVAGVTVPNLNYTNAPNTGLLIPIASITNQFSSSQGSPTYTFVNIPATSTGGGVIVTNATTIQYTPTNNPGSDTFVYYVNDGVTTSAAGTVTVYFQAVSGAQISPASITTVGGYNQFTFHGIPNTGYHVQVATTLSPPDWTNADSGSTAGADGSFVWTDPVTQATRMAATGQAYYRLTYP